MPSKAAKYAALACAVAAVFAPLAALSKGFFPSPCGSRPAKAAPARPLLKRLTGAFRSALLPSRWDSREEGWVSGVKDQRPYNTCWAFAAYATLEAQLLKRNAGELDFSEKNMVFLHGFEPAVDIGGTFDMAAAYLLRWGGAVAETNDVYMSPGARHQASVPRIPAVKVQNVVWIPPRESVTDNAALKAAVMEYGAVCVSMYCSEDYMAPSGAYYYSGNLIDHAVAVVGWDDAYPRENFLKDPGGDGAWLVKNSWGESKGDNGYLHVSYFDTAFATDCCGAVFVPATEEEDYTAAYGYDKLGACWYPLDGDACPIAAVFKAAWNEELAAVGLYSCVESVAYNLHIYTNLVENAVNPVSSGTLAHSQSGVLPHLGYNTIHLETPVPLAEGDWFSVVFENTASGERYFATNVQIGGYSAEKPVPSRTFYKMRGSWYDSAIQSPNLTFSYDGSSFAAYGNICMKAYTRTTAASRGDAPGETTDGAAMCADFQDKYGDLYTQSAETFGAFANIVGLNGRSLWASWLIGLDPADAEKDFVLDISVSNGIPSLAFAPDLRPERTYRTWGKANLSDPWREIDDLSASDAHFFQVTVEPAP